MRLIWIILWWIVAAVLIADGFTGAVNYFYPWHDWFTVNLTTMPAQMFSSILVGLGVFILLATFIVPRLSSRREDRLEGDSQSKVFTRQFKASAPARERFWEILAPAYDRWRGGRSELPPSLERLLRRVDFPEDLPLPREASFVTWARKTPDTWSDSKLALWQFVSEVYPERTKSGQLLTETALMDATVFQEFHDLRQDLARAWDRWGREIFIGRVLPDRLVKKYVVEQTQLIKCLIYLECALVRRTLDGGPGKIWMFGLIPLLTKGRAPRRGG
jgi:hypothetical protein